MLNHEGTEDFYALSPTQQGMLFNSLLAPQSGVDIEQIVCEMDEAPDAVALREAWQQVARRHAVFRTGFRWEGFQAPRQEVQREVILPFEQHDWRQIPREEQQLRLEAFVAEERGRGFDMARPPLMRLGLLHLGAARSCLVWTFHHALLDGRCFPIILKEVFELYEAQRRGETLALGQPRPYRDYIHWLQGQDFLAAESFWRALLKGFRAPTPLVIDQPGRPKPEIRRPKEGRSARAEARNAEPPDRVRSAECGVQSEGCRMGRGGTRPYRVSYGEVTGALSESLTGALNALAKANGLTLNTLVQGAWALVLSRYSGEEDVVFGATRAGRKATIEGAEAMVGVFINTLPVRVRVDPEAVLLDWLQALRAEQLRIREQEHTPLLQIQQWSELPAGSALFESLLVFEHATLDTALRRQGAQWAGRRFRVIDQTNYALTLFAYAEPRLEFKLSYDRRRLEEPAVSRLLGHLQTVLEAMAATPSQRLADLPLLTRAERQQVLVEWNHTRVPFAEVCVHELIEAQARKSPEAIAVVFEDQQLSYGTLNRRANQLAHYLRKCKVGPEVLVGICMEVSVEMLVGLLGVLKAGGAYVPLDPNYPKERLGFMMRDARIPVLLTQEALLGFLPEAIPSAECKVQSAEWEPRINKAQTATAQSADSGVADSALNTRVICLDSEWESIERESPEAPASGATPAHLAYVIYTSGSTGQPKGVMVTHRNVANFFAGMDDRLGLEPSGVWLAVTSISFDISVLELFWTLARGFKVVLQRPQARAPRTACLRAQSGKRIDFSLFYFASDEAAADSQKYHLLLEGAKFADEQDFAAIWTPERHFHAFGGLYPNPSITSAAIAATTKRLQIRAGSVVLPLHNPIRVAEEWAMVDNLSQGRVGISVASGWQVNDFVLAPENYLRRKEVMLLDIEIVRKLWRGEAVTFFGADGQEVPIRILPRPIQRELPLWITAAGNPESFKLAGELGANVLTHLLGQSPAELVEKIAAYRAAWQRKGHPGRGCVTLMLHTFVGADHKAVRELVRQPLLGYLRSSIDLIKNAPWSFPTFKRPESAPGLERAEGPARFTEEELDLMSNRAFERYFETSGLFGPVELCVERVEQLRALGVDEIACLIDFGVASEAVLAGLEQLNEVREQSTRQAKTRNADYSLGAQILRHGVTHLQCTPSLVAMLAEDSSVLPALRSLRQLLLGGEPLPAALAGQLALSGALLNMYGPTETTVWSATYRVTPGERTVPIGRPIANTEIYIVDKLLRPVPVGVPGEVLIGGAGVSRGYLHRPELTAERFIPHLFSSDPAARLYRTGDQARYRADGSIEFLGRLDQQVKLRGFRVELGEIEAALRQHPHVKEAAVLVREDAPGDKRLVAYLVAGAAQTPLTQELREFLSQKLPAYMVPAAFMVVTGLPLTPNGKLDRKALPTPGEAPDAGRAFVPPSSPTELKVAAIWREVLGRKAADIHEDFFESGGHSLLATQLVSRLRAAFHWEVPLRLVFDCPTIHALAKALSGRAGSPSEMAPAEHEPIPRRLHTGAVPLSFAQQRMWFLNQLEPGPHYNDHFDFRLTGPLEVPMLEKALQEIVRRHDTLRARFEKVEGNPVQIIAPTLEVPMPRVDLSDRAQPEREREATRLAVEESRQLFDLEQGPLLRAKLLQLGPEEHLLLLTFHHIIIDGWSRGVLVGELTALYQAFLAGQPSPLPELPIQYADFAVWQQQWLQGPTLEGHLAYWKEHLRGIPPLLELPADRPRPALQTYRGARQGLELSRSLFEQVSALGQQGGCTPFMVLLAAFQLLLARYTGRDDIVVGSPIANRNRAEIEGLIGYFLNSLVLRSDLSGDPTVVEWLRRVRQVALEAYAHQDLPFERLVLELQPVRDLGYSPIFQVMMVLQNAPMPELKTGNLVFQPYEIDTGISKVDLTLNLEESSRGCAGWIEYASDLFDSGTITQLVQDFQTLLEAMVAHPDYRLSQLFSLAPSGGEMAGVRGGLNSRLSTLNSQLSTPSPRRSARLTLSPPGHTVPKTEEAAVTPQTQVERQLARIWSEVLGIEGICLQDNWFDLGGHSLLLTQIIVRIRHAFEVEVPLQAFFETPTLGAISARVESLLQRGQKIAPSRGGAIPKRQRLGAGRGGGVQSEE